MKTNTWQTLITEKTINSLYHKSVYRHTIYFNKHTEQFFYNVITYIVEICFIQFLAMLKPETACHKQDFMAWMTDWILKNIV